VSVDSVLASLPLRARVAQLVMPWMPGFYVAADDPSFERVERWVDSLGVGGIIVSIGSPLDVAGRINALQRRARVPLLVASDLEGGTTFRLVGGTPFPTNMGVAATGRDEDAYQMGRVTAIEGRAVGIHLAFAPVADINSNPLNPIINTRSFGQDPAQVGRLVAAEIRGMQDHGMLATAKHFPGHGDTQVDSHLFLPSLDVSWSRLDSMELVPFRSAVAAGVAAIMSAHIAVPALAGPGRPATLAPSVLGAVLRDSLRFQGLVVTDALNMGGIVGNFGAGEAAVLALEAGADLLLQPADPAVTIDAVEAAVRSGRISEARLNVSVRRVLELKQRAGVFNRKLVDLDQVMLSVGGAESVDTARAIAQRAIVLVKDDGGIVDSLRARRGRRTLILYGDEVNVGAGNGLAAELRLRGDTLTTFRLTPSSGPASYDSARVALTRNPQAIIAVAIRANAFRGTIGMPDALAELVDGSAVMRPTTLVSLGSPYIIQQVPRVGSYLVAWAANATSEWAAAGALAGAPISGRLPIGIPGVAMLGDGLQRN
jgi:beta-N-acetylhexosaminidase